MEIKVTKSVAVTRLGVLTKAVDGLRSGDARSPEFLKWHEDVKRTLEYVFGPSWDEITAFTYIDFGRDWRMSPEGERRVFQEGLNESYALITSYITQIENEYEDNAGSMQSDTPGERDASIDSNQVFVVHGRDMGALAEVKLALSRLGLEPVVLQDLPNQGRTIIEKFEVHSQVGFAVVLCTPDDDGGLASADVERKPRVRQNVLLEWGFFLGRLGRKVVFALIKDEVEIPSDYDGVLYVEMDDGGAWKMKLVRELKAAQYSIDANKLI